MAMKGTFAPQGIKVVVIMVIRTVSFVLDCTGSHDTGNTAAHTNQHRNEGLTGKTELTENSVHDECDTCHIAAGLQECQEDKQYQHLRYETKNCTNTGYNTIKD